MGILSLSKVIGDHAPNAIKENDIKTYFGRKVAIDASMSIYQFLIAVRQEGNTLVNADGETTSHLMGMFYRTIRMVENGIKPVYVFDGKPPDMKSLELGKRRERRDLAEKQLAKAEDEGDVENIERFSKRLVKATPKHNDDCKRLLKLMGIPVVLAPCEAEAQCAELQKNGKVFAVGTDDMDALTFGTNILLRHMTMSEAKKIPIKEFNLEKVLSTMELSQDQFIDMCILLGCDYCESIRGIGPKRAVELLKKHGDLTAIISNFDANKYSIPEDWPYETVRNLFKNPEVTKAEDIELKWGEPDIEGLVKFMVDENAFNEDRVRSGIKKLQKAKQTSTQGRLDSFFTITPKAAPKRQIEEKAKPAKKSRGGFKKPK